MPRTATDLLDYLSDPASVLPEPYDLDDMATRIADLHRQNSGATFNRYFGDMSGQKLYAVALYPEQSATLPSRSVSVSDLREYMETVQRLLQDARNNIGTWYNEDQDETYFDVTTTLSSIDEAIAAAYQYNQIAIYDLAGQREIGTGGTGKATDALPKESERLPKLMRGKRGKRNG